MNNTPSQKSIYIWNLLGNLAAAAVSVCFLIIVSRFQNSTIADQYSLTISIGNLWVIIGLFQVRNYQATDIVNKFSFKNYYTARIISTILMWITLYPYLVYIHYDLSSSFVIGLTFLILAYRTCDVWSDLYQGLFQQKSRLDIAGKSMFFRYLISVVILFVSLMIQKNLLVGFLLVLIFNILFIVGFDIKFSKLFHSSDNKRTFSINDLIQGLLILKDCFSLFIYGFLINLIFNEPRIIISQQLLSQKMQSGVQRDFNILFMPVFFMSLCILVIRPLITSLAEKRQAGEMVQFYSIIKRIFVFLCSIHGNPFFQSLVHMQQQTGSRIASCLLFQGRVKGLFTKLCRDFFKQSIHAVIFQRFLEFGNVFVRIHHACLQSLRIFFHSTCECCDFRFHRGIIEGKAVMRSGYGGFIVFHKHH